MNISHLLSKINFAWIRIGEMYSISVLNIPLTLLVLAVLQTVQLLVGHDLVLNIPLTLLVLAVLQTVQLMIGHDLVLNISLTLLVLAVLLQTVQLLVGHDLVLNIPLTLPCADSPTDSATHDRSRSCLKYPFNSSLCWQSYRQCNS